MTYENEKIINCTEFEGLLTDYLDGTLDEGNAQGGRRSRACAVLSAMRF